MLVGAGYLSLVRARGHINREQPVEVALLFRLCRVIPTICIICTRVSRAGMSGVSAIMRNPKAGDHLVALKFRGSLLWNCSPLLGIRLPL